MKQIIAVDAAALHEFASVDEGESEAVALAFVELLFAETNAFYEQHLLTRRTLHRLSDHLTGNVVGAIFAAVLQGEASIPESRFQSEGEPEPSARDRHSVHSLPCRSPDERYRNQNDSMSSSSEKLQTIGGGALSPTRESRSSGSPEKLGGSAGASGGLPRTRRKAADKAVTLTDRSVSHLAIPEIQELPEEEDEKPDTRAWRAQCLKELTASSKKKQSFSKWATVARAFAPANSDQKMSMEVEIVESTPPLLQKEVLLTSSSSTSSIRMKSNVDSFSNVVDLAPLLPEDEQQNTSRSHWSHFTAGDSLYDSAAGYSAKSRKSALLLVAPASSTNQKAATKKKSGNGVMHLNDKLSRKRSIVNGTGAGNSIASGGGNISTRRLWKYEGDGNRVAQPFTPELSDFNATALPSTIQLASGVVLSQGESLVEGPTRTESANTMSRKRFDLHQSLATDLLLHWSERDSLMSSSSAASSPSYHHNDHHHNHQLKSYEEVPAEPIPAPYLSPIPTSALAIPRTHLAQSLSAPALRVRSPTNSKQSGPPSLSNSASGVVNTSNEFAKHRPRTARLMGKPSTTGGGGTPGASASILTKKNARGGSAGNSTSNAAKAKAKYLREFPKPQPGVVKLSQIDDSQRLAWISS